MHTHGSRDVTDHHEAVGDDDIVSVTASRVGVVHRPEYALPERRGSVVHISSRFPVHKPEPESTIRVPGLYGRRGGESGEGDTGLSARSMFS